MPKKKILLESLVNNKLEQQRFVNLLKASIFDPSAKVRVDSAITVRDRYQPDIRKVYCLDKLVYIKVVDEKNPERIFRVFWLPEQYQGKKYEALFWDMDSDVEDTEYWMF